MKKILIVGSNGAGTSAAIAIEKIKEQYPNVEVYDLESAKQAGLTAKDFDKTFEPEPLKITFTEPLPLYMTDLSLHKNGKLGKGGRARKRSGKNKNYF